MTTNLIINYKSMTVTKGMENDQYNKGNRADYGYSKMNEGFF